MMSGIFSLGVPAFPHYFPGSTVIKFAMALYCNELNVLVRRLRVALKLSFVLQV